MTRWAIALLMMAFIAAVIGFSGLIAAQPSIFARLLFFVFLILFLVALLFGRRLID